MNENVVTLVLPESTVIGLMALIGNGITSQVCDDLHLDRLYAGLADEFGRADLEGTKGLVGRNDITVESGARLRGAPRYTHIDLT